VQAFSLGPPQHAPPSTFRCEFCRLLVNSSDPSTSAVWFPTGEPDHWVAFCDDTCAADYRRRGRTPTANA
jgi:hypothetical protein